VVTFRGHPLVKGTHPTTIEVTTEGHLTEKGDCIIGVSASTGCSGLREETKRALQTAESEVLLTIRVGENEVSLRARGDPGLTLTHPHDIVIRRSGFLSDRTLAVGADQAAVDLPRRMIQLLRNSSALGELEIGVL
jgi:uncharacterized protein